MLLKIAKLYIPELIKNKKLGDLFRITAVAFQCEAPDLKGLPYAERLRECAAFTREQAEKILQSEGSPDERKRRIDAVEEELYRQSFLFGQDLRKSLRIKNRKQAVEALALIYRIIGIDFQADCPAGSRRDCPAGTESSRPDRSKQDRQFEFTVKECYFSGYYSAEVCGLISSLDAGLAAGLTGGGRLAFTQRITEGCGCCRGFLTFSNMY